LFSHLQAYPSKAPSFFVNRLCRCHASTIASMSKMRHGLGLCLVLCLSVGLAACDSDEAPMPSPTITPRATRTPRPTDIPPPTPTVQVIVTPVAAPLASPLTSPLRPAINAMGASKRVLFVQGDFVPESGYPHSRVSDGGAHPESFSHLRSEVLERDLKLGVDEKILTRDNALTLQELMDYSVVVLGSNARSFTSDELIALANYFLGGGSLLVYADFQYGPTNWDSDNSLLRSFGIEVLSDNFQPTALITDVVDTHPVFAHVRALQVEGISQFLVSANVMSETTVLAKCTPADRAGCILPPPDAAKIKSGDQVACVFTREHANGGRIAGVCDRNLFQNGPGPGSDLDQADNRLFARNLFAWLTHQ